MDLTTKGGPRYGAMTRSVTTLEEDVGADDAGARAPANQGEGRGDRDRRVARRRALMDREKQDSELGAQMDAWRLLIDHEEQGEARTEREKLRCTWRPQRTGRTTVLRDTPLTMSTRTRNRPTLINRRLMSRRIR